MSDTHAAAEPEISVEIVDDAAANLDAAKGNEGGDKGEGDGGARKDDPVEDLRSQFHNLRSKFEQSEVEKNKAIEIAAAATQRVEQVETQFKERTAIDRRQQIESSLASAKAVADAAEAQLREAFDRGDSAAVSRAQRQIARAEAEILRYEEAATDLDGLEADTARPARQEQQQPGQRAADPVESFIATRTPKSQEWLRNHKDWITDPRKSNKLTAAHHDAVGEGITPDTTEYFEHVEKYLGIRKDAETRKDGGDRRQTRQGAPTVPVNASGNDGGHGTGARTMRLTRAEATAATDGTHVWNWDDPKGKFKKGDPIGVQEFARRKEQMQKSGWYDRSYSES